MTFNPHSDFTHGQQVEWTLSTVAEDTSGNKLASSTSGSFWVARLNTRDLLSVAALDGNMFNDGTITPVGRRCVDWRLQHREICPGLLLLRPHRAHRDGGAHQLGHPLPLPDWHGRQPRRQTWARFWVQNVSYGPTLDVADFNVAPYQRTFCRPRPGFPVELECELFDDQWAVDVTSPGPKSVAVTARCKGDWADRTARGSRSQFRLKFDRDVSYDNQSDYVLVRHAGVTRPALVRPYLKVEYEYE